jgi:hypothetical protein
VPLCGIRPASGLWVRWAVGCGNTALLAPSSRRLLDVACARLMLVRGREPLPQGIGRLTDANPGCRSTPVGAARNGAWGPVFPSDTCLSPGVLPLARPPGRAGGRAPALRCPPGGAVAGGYLVDSASSHMLVSKIKPCMSKYKQLYSETANGSLNQLSYI